jgi:hypothetical protein
MTERKSLFTVKNYFIVLAIPPPGGGQISSNPIQLKPDG